LSVEFREPPGLPLCFIVRHGWLGT
jgi:hypothetical protein